MEERFYERIGWMEAKLQAASLPPFCPPLTFKEPNYRNVITKQLKLTPDLSFPECTPCLG